MMSVSEILDINAARAKEEAEALEKDAAMQRALDDFHAAQEEKRLRRCRVADNRMLLRAGLFMAAFIAILDCVCSGLMAEVLAGLLILAAACWFSFRLGLWWQFRIVGGGRKYGAE